MSTTTEAILAALRVGPADAAPIAERAGIGHSTASKALVALAGESRVVRTPGGGEGARRLPDTWSLPAAAAIPAETADPTEPPEAATQSASTAGRLAKGELRSLVLAYLNEHPGEHTPTAVAKALQGRSAGAVANALATLATGGKIALTTVAPRRYRATS